MKTLNKYIAVAVLISSSLAGQAQQGNDIKVNCKQLVQRGDSLYIKALIEIPGGTVKSSRFIVLTPVLESGSQKSGLPSVVVNGKNRQKAYNREHALGNASEEYPTYKVVTVKKNETETIPYILSVKYEAWMKDARLVIDPDLCGCGKEKPGAPIIAASGLQEDHPAMAFITPEAEMVKQRAEEKTAHVIFKIDKWDVLPELFNNTEELAEINSTISEITTDQNVKPTGISLKGFASPEGSYAWNTTLANNRVNAIRDYIVDKNGLTEDFITVAAEPENWEGFKAAVEADMNVPSRNEVLEIINSNAAPDTKEARLRDLGNTSFFYVVNKLFPTLRRTDYKVSYNVRGFSVEEAREIIKTSPKQLSLAEMVAVANSYPKNGKKYNETYYIAARTFENNPVANVNAANVALNQKDLTAARNFLQKAGNSPEALNANGILNMLEGNITEAEQLFEQAKAAGIKEADTNLKLLRGEQ